MVVNYCLITVLNHWFRSLIWITSSLTNLPDWLNKGTRVICYNVNQVMFLFRSWLLPPHLRLKAQVLTVQAAPWPSPAPRNFSDLTSYYSCHLLCASASLASLLFLKYARQAVLLQRDFLFTLSGMLFLPCPRGLLPHLLGIFFTYNFSMRLPQPLCLKLQPLLIHSILFYFSRDTLKLHYVLCLFY